MLCILSGWYFLTNLYTKALAVFILQGSNENVHDLKSKYLLLVEKIWGKTLHYTASCDPLHAYINEFNLIHW